MVLTEVWSTVSSELSVRARHIHTNKSCRYLLQNMDWFEEELGEYDSDYLIIDCPGTHPHLWSYSIFDSVARTN